MANSFIQFLTVPQNSTRDGIAIHTWRTLVTQDINGLRSNTANSGNVSANIAAAYNQANVARLTANNAYAKANQAAGTTNVYADGFLVMRDCGINFVNTTSVIISTGVDSPTNYCNVAMNVSFSGINTTITRIVYQLNPVLISYYGVY